MKILCDTYGVYEIVKQRLVSNGIICINICEPKKKDFSKYGIIVTVIGSWFSVFYSIIIDTTAMLANEFLCGDL